MLSIVSRRIARLARLRANLNTRWQQQQVEQRTYIDVFDIGGCCPRTHN